MSATLAILSLGLGKALNNTNSQLPGYMGSARVVIGDTWAGEAAYTRMGASYLSENAAISTTGVDYTHGSFRYGLSAITGASYSHAVWWDKKHPNDFCGVKECGIRYPSDGHHFSRACHLCGGVLSAEYLAPHNLGIRVEYYGLRHMSPTYQGVAVQFTYRIGL